MILGPWRQLGLLLLGLLLAACGGAPGLVKQNEPVRVLRVFEVESPIDWARYRGVNTETWTIDGIQLNRLTFLTNIKDRYHIFGYGKQTRRHPDGPFFKLGMEANELRDLLVDGLAQVGFANVSARNPRVMSKDGFTTYLVDLDLRSPDGLIYKGHALLFERRERLNIVLHYAANEYYYPRDDEAVLKLFEQIKIRP